MNKVELTGRLTKKPELRYTQGNEPIAVGNYTLAVNRKYKKESEKEADFIPCKIFGKSAEFAEKYFDKGLLIEVTGRLQVSSWQDEKQQVHYKTEVIVEEQGFLESKKSFEGRNAGNDSNYTVESTETNNDDLPF